MRLDKTKDCPIQKKLGNLIKIQYFWCSVKLAQEKGIAVLPDKVARNRSLRHTTRCLHRESGVHEDEG